MGRQQIADLTGWHDCGMVPWLSDASQLPAEDAVVLQDVKPQDCKRRVRIAVPMLSRIANFDDFDPLKADPRIDFSFVAPGNVIPADLDWIILPGTKATITDMAFLKSQGWDIDIRAHFRQGKPVLGICGGYQMLGRKIHDPAGIEGSPGSCDGLGLLDVETELTATKTLREVTGYLQPDGTPVTGYEIHVGRTDGPDSSRPIVLIGGSPHGAISPDALIQGLYLHGAFNLPAAREKLLGLSPDETAASDHTSQVDAALDRIAGILEHHLDLDHLYQLACTST